MWRCSGQAVGTCSYCGQRKYPRTCRTKTSRRHKVLLAGMIFVTIHLADCAGSKDMVSVSPEEQGRRIAEQELACLTSILDNPPLYSNGSHCPPVWDKLMCWPATPAGTTAVQACPNYVNLFRSDENATRTCTEDGLWFVNPLTNETWTNLTMCLMPDRPHFPEKLRTHLGHIRLMYNIGYGISLGSLALAVLIMLCLKKLHCPRNTIHLNLFASFILRASVSFMKENLLVAGLGFPSDVIQTPDSVFFLNQNSPHWECKLFFTCFHYVLGANYMWIFVEALYLHMLISVAVFSERSGIKFYIIFGWASPLSFVIPWVIVRATLEDELCWNTHPNEGYFWIMRAPIVLSIILNFALFLSIIRVLFTKLNAVNSPEAKKFRYRKLAKSTLVLIPLFGVHYIVFLGLPHHIDERAELVKLYFEMFFNSVQGFFVALLFCFLNGEVQSEVRKTWHRFRLTHQRSFHPRGSGRFPNCNTLTSYMSRTRESLGSLHVHDMRGRPDGRACNDTLIDETPLTSIEAAERQPLANGKPSHFHSLEDQPLASNGLRDFCQGRVVDRYQCDARGKSESIS
ncbi:secretin receptor-like isoform X2 [Pomacea canaliculata]|uniref:secretin receptor-like isoform X2 n=1 Tax=Pomacea canaliculata TaxID=400727 RepID=UPI000D739273|nr:secretin receptor-like isoform X2 [Pomacea canaliculata]